MGARARLSGHDQELLVGVRGRGQQLPVEGHLASHWMAKPLAAGGAAEDVARRPPPADCGSSAERSATSADTRVFQVTHADLPRNSRVAAMGQMTYDSIG
jgi:hypothetical protein